MGILQQSWCEAMVVCSRMVVEEAVRHGWIGCVFKVESELCIIYGVEEKEMGQR